MKHKFIACLVAPSLLSNGIAYAVEAEDEELIKHHRASKNLPVTPSEAAPSEVPSRTQQFPTLSFDLGDVGNATVSSNQASYSYQDDNTIFNANLGSNNNGLSQATTGADLAFIAGENTALGIKLKFSGDQSEGVLGAVHNLKPLNVQVRAALSYMQGSQEFNFYRSTERADLSQLGYYGSADWLSQAESNLGFHSAGVALWRAQTKNHSSFDTLTYTDETAESYIIIRDRRIISTGSLNGASFNLQYAPHPDLVINSALGAEQLKFPFSDGSSENKTTVFADAKISYRVDENNALGLAYKYGASEKGVRADWKWSAYTLNAYKSYGQSGLEGNYGINISVDLVKLLSKQKNKSSNLSLASSMRPKLNDNSKQLLQTAITRPAQLPSNFLAKVDETGVTQLVISKSQGQVAVDAQGNALINIEGAVGPLTSIVTENRNGVDVSTAGYFSLQNNQLVVHMALLPIPEGQDNYVVDVIDSIGNSFAVTFSISKAL
ncbi:hypothetical protein ABH309_21885 [Chromobacterium piscinae]|uniref:Uncharacterized protein n=1 Tax=Chromobacterium piscinae TaxID=686831 RepID=A0ABV0HAH4_9NEIS